MNKPIFYTRESPFYASIKTRDHLCKPGSLKNTQHIVLDIKDSNISYCPGDSIGILPINDPVLVQKTLTILKFTGQELIHDKKGQIHSLKDYFTSATNLKGISRNLLEVLKNQLTQEANTEILEKILTAADKESYKQFSTTHELWDLFQMFPTFSLTPQEAVNLFMPLLPRFYSIASAQIYVGDEIHLTVSYLQYTTREQPRIGVCTHFLCSLAKLHEPVIPIFIHPNPLFKPPVDKHLDMIMIGPGTGIAPFRSFLQERLTTQATGRNWLFFGEWTKQKEFFYENDWLEIQTKCPLKLSLAFSREQEQKVYVQHKMKEEAKELFEWLENGAYLYVCGDAHHMAKDVDFTLHQIIEESGMMSQEQAKNYVKQLKQQKRYLKDIY